MHTKHDRHSVTSAVKAPVLSPWSVCLQCVEGGIHKFLAHAAAGDTALASEQAVDLQQELASIRWARGAEAASLCRWIDPGRPAAGAREPRGAGGRKGPREQIDRPQSGCSRWRPPAGARIPASGVQAAWACAWTDPFQTAQAFRGVIVVGLLHIIYRQTPVRTSVQGHHRGGSICITWSPRSLLLLHMDRPPTISETNRTHIVLFRIGHAE
jgi:hypothetical protein